MENSVEICIKIGTKGFPQVEWSRSSRNLVMQKIFETAPIFKYRPQWSI